MSPPLVGPPIVFVAALGLEIFAEATEFSGWAQVLVNVGVAGYMLFWFTQRMERRSDENTRALNELRDEIRELRAERGR